MIRTAHFGSARAIRSSVLIAGWCVFSTAVAADVPLGGGTVLRFAEVPDGVAALTQRDDYIRQMSPFDRQVRVQTDRVVTEEELLAFLSQHVRAWTPEEIARLTPLVEDLARKLAPWKLNLPEVILLVKTSGREEGAAAYCRGPAIVLPQNMIDGLARRLPTILPHETFHVFSSHNPAAAAGALWSDRLPALQ
jgi:hypothetical protein